MVNGIRHISIEPAPTNALISEHVERIEQKGGETYYVTSKPKPCTKKKVNP